MPVETVLMRFYNMLFDKSIGPLFKPGQMRREGLVSLELDRIRMLSVAKTEMDVEDLKAGRKDISEFTSALGLSEKAKTGSVNSARIEPVIDILEALEVSKYEVLKDAVRHDINTTGAILFAEEALHKDDQPPPEEKVADDWLYRWRDYTGEISDVDLQRIWGRLLAGEVKAPGSYSLRCLEFLRNLSQQEAALIAKISPFVTEDFIWNRQDTPYALPLSREELIELQEMGILKGVHPKGLNHRVNKNINADGKGWISAYSCHELCVILKGDIDTYFNDIEFEVFSVTKLGMQLLKLGEYEADFNHVFYFARFLATFGNEVYTADHVPAGQGYLKWINERAVH